MTREEALETLLDNAEGGYVDVEEIKLVFAVLEQEPCEDCISRQAVLDLIADYDLSMGQVVKSIHALPSVTPKQKMGHWRHYDGMLYCSKCGAEFYDEIMEYTGDEVPKHCPDCGQSKMVEPQAEKGNE
jgi:DNA-directed RNA polymerase subunit RPC12/RpoP